MKKITNTIRLLAPALIVFFMLNACPETSRASPVASFSVNQTAGCAPLSTQFTSTSTGAVSYYWDLGNGNSSTLANPSNLYTTPGSYTISLVVTDALGQTDTAIQYNYINAIGKPDADFNCQATSSCLDNNLFSFNNTTIGGLTYLWDFGDGTFSTQVNPNHHYNQSGSFTITLIATNYYGCQDEKIRNLYITVFQKSNVTISTNALSSCDTGTVFNFTSGNAGIVSWNWNFGDGSTSNLPNPSHSYNSAGAYPVTLIVTDIHNCLDTASSNTVIHVGTSNWAGFSVDEDYGCAPFYVSFTNTNANVTSSTWNFGDGTGSSLNSPGHVYNLPGIYTVSLIVQTANGCTDTVIQNNMITAGMQPVVSFTHSAGEGCAPFLVHFNNTSSNYAGCQWNFGDGSSSNAVNPSHVYTSNGTYSVTLTCWGPTGCNMSTTQNNIIRVSSGHALFAASPRIGCPPLTVNFSNASYGNHLTYAWNFGDGTTSNLQTPSHVYSTSGIFNVRLVVTDSLGCTDTLYKPSYVQTMNPAANYIPPPTTTGCAPVTAQFTDATVGSSGWLWNFGDGTTSNLQNPTHTYLTPGFYTVTLTTQSAGGGCTQAISNFSSFDVRGGYAGFTHTDSPCPPYISTFTDTSLNAVSWFWDFGDGVTSTLQNPTHAFGVPGYHSVYLTITTSGGCTYTTMQSNSVYFPPFGANFYGIPIGSTYPMPVDFYANSLGATGWLWDFGDSSTSTLQNPTHIYQAFGNYNVTLTITNGTCSLSYAPPPYDFGTPDTTPIQPGNPGMPVVQQGCAPLAVSFSNLIEGAVNWHWDFGDGDTSLLPFPSHIYYRPGIYTVTLTTSDTLNLVSVLTMDSIVRVGGPRVNFSFSESPSCSNNLIQFHDTSIGAINSWYWDLGDGTNDTTRNVVHLYTGGMPNYMVTHRVTDTLGCSSTISTSIFSNFISPLLASESELCGMDTVHFMTSLQNYPTYLWDFGDGNTSALPQPTHVYTTEGSFPVSLTVSDSTGCTQSFTISPPIEVSLPLVNFTVNGTRHGCGATAFNFTNLSSNADSYFWEFGDGMTSTNQSPTHLFNTAGSYTVSLTIYRGNCIASISMPQYITIDTAYSNFDFSYNGICMPMTVAFTDRSANPVSWFWDFGNGDTSGLQNPVETFFNTTGTGIHLTITDVHGCTSNAYHGPMSPLAANFTIQDETGCSPFTAQFTNTSTMPYLYHWDFGDGDTSDVASPSHQYTSPGNFDVTLIVSNPFYHCIDTLTMPQLINVLQPVADFSSPDLAACAPSIVNFINHSTDADSYFWDFGDGTSSTNQDPSHIYSTPGVYTIRLIASNHLGCSDTLTRNQYIHVLGSITNFSASAYSGCNPFTVIFTDHSLGAVDWSWNFGDGYSSLQQNPSHLYSDTGSFTVSLVTHDTAGCSSYFEMPRNIVVSPNPLSLFTTNDTVGCQPLQVAFVNASSGYDSLFWNFGDGTLSTQLNPAHTFSIPGLYTVSLVATNQFGCADTFVFNHPIVVNEIPIPDFSLDTSQGCAGILVHLHNLSTHLLQPSYAWDFGNGMNSVLPNPIIQFPNPGFYDITLTVTNITGCTGTVTIPSSVHVFDTIPPAISEILSVSVTSNSTVKITWENNAAIDLGSYTLFRLNPATNAYDAIYTDSNPNNTGFALDPTYTDSGLNTLANTYTYKLQTFDLCGYSIGLDQLTAHTTINVSSARTGQNILVSWNSYEGCPVSSYDITRSYAGGAPVWIASVPPGQLNYLDTTFECPARYSYKITALDLCSRPYNSNSDTSVTMSFNFLADQVVDVVRSTVVSNQTVLTEWLQPVVHPEKVAQFDVYRSTDNVNFIYLASVPSVQTDYMDYNVDVQHNSYFYKIKVVNTCDIDEDPGMNTSTILLKGEMHEDRTVHLSWLPYAGWTEGVDYYIIEKLENNGQWQLLRQVAGDVIQYDYQE